MKNVINSLLLTLISVTSVSASDVCIQCETVDLPEPGALALLLMGFVAIGVVRFLKK